MKICALVLLCTALKVSSFAIDLLHLNLVVASVHRNTPISFLHAGEVCCSICLDIKLELHWRIWEMKHLQWTVKNLCVQLLITRGQLYFWPSWTLGRNADGVHQQWLYKVLRLMARCSPGKMYLIYHGLQSGSHVLVPPGQVSVLAGQREDGPHFCALLAQQV